MERRRLPWLAALAAVVCLSVPCPANAQIGGLIKKKVKQSVQGQAPAQKQAPAAAESAGGGSGPTFNDYTLELNATNLDRLETALVAEKAFRDSVNAFYAKLPTAEQYQQCHMRVIRDPEVQKLASHMTDAASMQAVGVKMQAITEKRCGREPGTFRKGDDLRPATARGQKAGGFTTAQYSIAKERIAPFCASGGQARVKGAMRGMFYVYSAAEVAAIQPRCAKLTRLLPLKSSSAEEEEE